LQQNIYVLREFKIEAKFNNSRNASCDLVEKLLYRKKKLDHMQHKFCFED